MDDDQTTLRNATTDVDLQLDLSRHQILDNVAPERAGHVYGTATCSAAIAYPDFTVPDAEDQRVTHFLRWIGDRMIRVLARLKKDGRWLVITAHDDEDETRRFRRDRPEIAAKPAPDLAARRRFRDS
jgi:hypothetical protein